jgi:MoxR-like ATPase
MTDVEAQVAQFGENFQSVRTEIAKVIVGHAEVVEGLLTCLLCGGHALLEGVSGLGKTLLVKSLGAARIWISHAFSSPRTLCRPISLARGWCPG